MSALVRLTPGVGLPAPPLLERGARHPPLMPDPLSRGCKIGDEGLKVTDLLTQGLDEPELGNPVCVENGVPGLLEAGG